MATYSTRQEWLPIAKGKTGPHASYPGDVTHRDMNAMAPFPFVTVIKRENLGQVLDVTREQRRRKERGMDAYQDSRVGFVDRILDLVFVGSWRLDTGSPLRLRFA